MVVQDRRDNQSPVQNPSHQNGVLELGELVTEPTVRGVPKKLFSWDWESGWALRGIGKWGFERIEGKRSGGERAVEKEEEEEEEEQEGEADEWRSV